MDYETGVRLERIEAGVAFLVNHVQKQNGKDLEQPLPKMPEPPKPDKVVESPL